MTSSQAHFHAWGSITSTCSNGESGRIPKSCPVPSLYSEAWKSVKSLDDTVRSRRDTKYCIL
jgi:hypothetical protein